MPVNTSNIAFSGKRKNGQRYINFERFSREQNLQGKIAEIISDEQNYISEGCNSRVYSIPGCDKFVLKVAKAVDNEGLKGKKCVLRQIKDNFPNINVGQAIAKFGEHVSVLIKQEGEQSGVLFSKKYNLGKEDVPKYLESVEKIARVPQQGYNQFAEELKEVYSKGYYIDYFNANNIMINKDEINSVDLVKIKPGRKSALFFPSSDNIVKGLLDNGALVQLYPHMSDEQKIMLGENVSIIKERVSNGMKESGLRDNKIKATFVSILQDTFFNGRNREYYSIIKGIKK